MKYSLMSLIFGMATATAAHAEVVVFNFTATVSSAIKEYGPVDSRAGAYFDNTVIRAGDTLTGSFSINLATPYILYQGALHDGVASAMYAFPDDSQAKTSNDITFKVNQTGYVVAPRGKPWTTFYVDNDVPGGTYGDTFRSETLSSANLNQPNETAERIEFEFAQTDGQMYRAAAPGQPDWALPTFFSRDGMSRATLKYDYATYQQVPNGAYVSGGWDIRADINSITVQSTSPVPEPSTYLMLGAGLLAVGAARRRRA